MKLSHFLFGSPFEWSGNNVCSLIIENPKYYRDTLMGLIAQANGFDGDFILSDNDKCIAIDKALDVISDVFQVEPSENKLIVGGVQKEVAACAAHERIAELTELFAHINDTVSNLCYASDMELTFDEVNDISVLLKAYHLRPDTEKLSLSEKLLAYMELSRRYAKKQIFVIVNLRSCLTDEEAASFCKDIIYRKLNVLMIESSQKEPLKCEQRKLIDMDLCEI